MFTDPDVSPAVLKTVGADLPPTVGPAPESVSADGTVPAVMACGPDIRPALGDPTEVARILAAEAKTGVDVVRLVAGDPLSSDSVSTEVNAVARTNLAFEIVPGLPATAAVPTYAGLPIGSTHTVADVRGEVDWAALAAAPGPLILTATAEHLADAARSLIEYGLADGTPCVVTAQGTTCAQRSIESTLQGLTDRTALGTGDPAGPLAGPLVVTIGRTVTQRSKLNWWESRALYGWTVLVPRTKEQAGDMSDRLISHGALPIEVPTIAVEPPRSPAQMERAVKGLVDGRYQWVVFTSTNAVRAVWDKFAEFGLDARAFSGVKIACVGESTADRVRAFGISPELVPSGEQSRSACWTNSRSTTAFSTPSTGCCCPVPTSPPRPLPRVCGNAAGRSRTSPPTAPCARHPAGRDPRDDQDRRIRRGLLHLQFHGAQSGGYRRKAACPDHRGLHRSEDGRDRGRVRSAGGRTTGDRRGRTAGRCVGRARRPAAGRGRAAPPRKKSRRR